MDITKIIGDYGVLGLLAWLIFQIVTKIAPAMEKMGSSVDGLKNAIEKETAKICKFSDCNLDREKNDDTISLSTSGKRENPPD